MDTYTQPVTTKRRYLPLEDKQRIVEGTLVAGASVRRIARTHGTERKPGIPTGAELERDRFVWRQASGGDSETHLLFEPAPSSAGNHDFRAGLESNQKSTTVRFNVFDILQVDNTVTVGTKEHGRIRRLSM